MLRTISSWVSSVGSPLSLGGLLSFAILLAYLYPPLQSLAGTPLVVSAASAGAARIREILDVEPAVHHDGRMTRNPGCGL